MYQKQFSCKKCNWSWIRIRAKKPRFCKCKEWLEMQSRMIKKEVPVKTFVEQVIPVKKKRGRPVGSWVKPKIVEATVINCTWHDISIKWWETIKPHIRLRMAEETEYMKTVWGVPIYSVKYSVWSLPEKKPNVIYIVGNIIAQCAKDRDDLYTPYKVDHALKCCVGITQNPYFVKR